MKKIIFILMIFCAAIVQAQEKLVQRVQSPLAFNPTLCQLRINPSDTLWRAFKAPASPFKGLPMFVADYNAKMYTVQEYNDFMLLFDKLMNADKNYPTQESTRDDYDKFMRLYVYRGRNK
nr:hypothetical protein [Bacteroidota bacterium]